MLLKPFSLWNFQGYINTGLPQAAITVYEEILRIGLRPDKLTYNTLIFACVKSEKLDAARHVFKEMKVASMYLEGQFRAWYLFFSSSGELPRLLKLHFFLVRTKHRNMAVAFSLML